MQKGKFGFKLWVYPVAAILLLILGQFLAAALVVAFGIAAEKHQWLSHQLLQVFFFGVFAEIADGFIGLLRWFFNGLFYLPSSVWNIFRIIFSIFDLAFDVAFLVFFIIAIINIVRGKDARLPGAASVANCAFGILPVVPQMPQTPQMPQAPQQPQYQPYQPAQPVQPTQPTQQPPQQ